MPPGLRILVLAVLLPPIFLPPNFLPWGLSPARADYTRGLAAYEMGDFPTAAREFAPAARGGDARAQTMLGRMYAWGLGVPQDMGQARSWLQQGAARGDADAVTALRDYGLPATSAPSGTPSSGVPSVAPPSDQGRIVLLEPRSVRQPPVAASPYPQPPRLRAAGGREMVRTLQRELNRAGYHAGPVDGRVGHLTRQGVRAYERDHDLPQTGRATPDLLSRLLSEQAPQQARIP